MADQFIVMERFESGGALLVLAALCHRDPLVIWVSRILGLPLNLLEGSFPASYGVLYQWPILLESAHPWFGSRLSLTLALLALGLWIQVTLGWIYLGGTSALGLRSGASFWTKAHHFRCYGL